MGSDGQQPARLRWVTVGQSTIEGACQQTGQEPRPSPIRPRCQSLPVIRVDKEEGRRPADRPFRLPGAGLTSLPALAAGHPSPLVGTSHPTILYADLHHRKWHHRHSARRTCQTWQTGRKPTGPPSEAVRSAARAPVQRVLRRPDSRGWPRRHAPWSTGGGPVPHRRGPDAGPASSRTRGRCGRQRIWPPSGR